MLESHLPILKRLSPFAALNDVASISIPFIQLRDHLNELPKDVIYVVQGPSSPKIGMVGAYLLNENGFIAYVLEQHS